MTMGILAAHSIITTQPIPSKPLATRRTLSVSPVSTSRLISFIKMRCNRGQAQSRNRLPFDEPRCWRDANRPVAGRADRLALDRRTDRDFLSRHRAAGDDLCGYVAI